MTAQATLTC